MPILPLWTLLPEVWEVSDKRDNRKLSQKGVQVQGKTHFWRCFWTLFWRGCQADVVFACEITKGRLFTSKTLFWGYFEVIV